MKWKKKAAPAVGAVACQLRRKEHPFSNLRGYVPLGGGEEQIYHEIREAIPVLDAAIGKLVRLSGGFSVRCPDKAAQRKLEDFLKTVPTGHAQIGVDSFLSCYVDSLLTYGRAVGELVVHNGHLRAVCWGDVRSVEIQEGETPLDLRLCAPGESGRVEPLPYQELLLFTTWQPEPEHPYGVSLFRGMPFLADILMKIYTAMGSNWERAGNVRYSVVCKNDDGLDAAAVRQRGAEMAEEWSRAMEDGKNGTVRDFVAVGDVEIKVIGGEAPILDSQVPVRQILEQLVAKTGLPPFLLGLSWSSTERMSSQQADIMTSELTALRRTLTPVVEKICRLWMRLQGLDAAFQVEWEPINLQDQVEMAKAELYRQQAAQLARRADEGENEAKKEDGDGDSTQAGPGKA